MASEVDVLLQSWREQRDQARQSENQRAVMTNIVLVLASAGLGLIAQHGVHGQAMLIVTLSLMVLGGYGALTSLKYRERYELHIMQARAMWRRLDALYPDLHLEEDWAASRARHRERYKIPYNLRLGYLWVTLHAAIAIAGLGLTIAIAT